MPYIAPSSNEIPKASERRCEGKDNRIAQLQQRHLVLVTQTAEEVNIAQAQRGGLCMQFLLQRTGTDNHHGIIDVFERVEQDVQALVITHHPDEQKNLSPSCWRQRFMRSVSGCG